MRLLVIGSGGREHVLAWRLAQDAASHNLHAAPGNPGIAAFGRCHAVPPTDIPALVGLAETLQPDLTIIGPEAPLAAGLVDALRSRGLRAFGPTQSAAQLESSKVFSKHLMHRHRIPTAAYEVFERPEDAIAYARGAGRHLVIKADGLAAGKGVVVTNTPAEAERAVLDLMVRRIHGPAGGRIVIEEHLVGREASVLAFVQGSRVWPLLPAQDYKRAHEGDTGPNTGGMGALAPASLSPALAAEIVDDILEPVASAMVAEGLPYSGVLYAGVMLTADGPQVLEFNCRFGDPEAQVILPLVDGDLAQAMSDVLGGRTPDLRWRDGAAVCVVLASGGYPGPYQTGQVIAGLDRVPDDVLLFHAGTAMRDGRLLTAGGRVLNVVGRGSDLEAARVRAYAGAGAISFEGMHYRRDIATLRTPEPAQVVIA